MNKPLLVVVTGRPASGKTTLAHILAKEIEFQVISRDELKEGYLIAKDINHSETDNSIDWLIYEIFFQVIEKFLSQGISIVVEAAFQDKLWKPKLLKLLEIAEIKIIICKTTSNISAIRFNERLINKPERKRFHGDKLVNLVKEQIAFQGEPYVPVNIDVPILEVDTTDNYRPNLGKVVQFIKKKTSTKTQD